MVSRDICCTSIFLLPCIAVLLVLVSISEAGKPQNEASSTSVSHMSLGCDFDRKISSNAVEISCVCPTIINDDGTAVGGGAVAAAFEFVGGNQKDSRKFGKCVAKLIRSKCVRRGVLGFARSEAAARKCCSRLGGTFQDFKCLN